MRTVMNIVIYGVLLVGVIILLRQAIKQRGTKKKIDSNIDIIAYSIMAVGLVLLFVTCIVEVIIGHPLFS